MKISHKGIDLIKEFERFENDIYICSAGKHTIGYGHVLVGDEIRNMKGPITEEHAEILLFKDIQIAEKTINSLVKVHLTQGQFDALASLVFNWGINNFSHSKGLKKLNDNDYNEAAIEFFSKGKGVVFVNKKFFSGLYRRRQRELELWNLNT